MSPGTATTPEIILPVGTALYHGSGEEWDGDQPQVGGYDSIFWTTTSHTVARSYIPRSGMTLMTSLGHLIEPPAKNSGTERYQKQLGIEYTDIDYRGDIRAQSYRYPKLFGELMKDVPRPKEQGVSPEGKILDRKAFDTYLDEKFAWEKEQERRIEDYVLAKLKELGYEPEDNGGGSRKHMGFRLQVDNDSILPNKPQEGTLRRYKTTSPLRIYDNTFGGSVEGDLTNVEYHSHKLFRSTERQGFDGIKINDFAQVHEHGNVGHTSIGIFKHSLHKLRLDAKEVSHHPEDMWADIKKNGSSRRSRLLKRRAALAQPPEPPLQPPALIDFLEPQRQVPSWVKSPTKFQGVGKEKSICGDPYMARQGAWGNAVRDLTNKTLENFEKQYSGRIQNGKFSNKVRNVILNYIADMAVGNVYYTDREGNISYALVEIGQPHLNWLEKNIILKAIDTGLQ